MKLVQAVRNLRVTANNIQKYVNGGSKYKYKEHDQIVILMKHLLKDTSDIENAIKDDGTVNIEINKEHLEALINAARYQIEHSDRQPLYLKSAIARLRAVIMNEFTDPPANVHWDQL